MGGGAKRCAQRRVFHAHLGGLRALCARALNRALCGCSLPVRPWPHVQTDASDSPLCASASGLLAVAPI